MQPHAGILPPHSTQEIKVRRTLKENETEDMQCKDKISVWNGIVSEGVEASDVGKYWNEDDKELPVVLTNVSSLIWRLAPGCIRPLYLKCIFYIFEKCQKKFKQQCRVHISMSYVPMKWF
jgi:hypothetical protein